MKVNNATNSEWTNKYYGAAYVLGECFKSVEICVESKIIRKPLVGLERNYDISGFRPHIFVQAKETI